MPTPVDRLLDHLQLEQGDTSEASTTWIGKAGEVAMNMSGRLFGGMVVAQTIAAVGSTHTERDVHSLQQVFLRAGEADVPLYYRVERLFDGRTYASVRVEVRQGDHIISHAQVGVTAGGEGPDRSSPSPARTSLASTVNRDEARGRPNWQNQPVEVRIDPDRADDGEPTIENWIKPSGDLPTDPLMHKAVLGYVSDRAFMNVAWKPHGAQSSYRGATLDHAIWFHRPVKFDDWHVYAIHSPTLAGGRGLIQGAIYDQAGNHIATTTQQSMFRPT